MGVRKVDLSPPNTEKTLRSRHTGAKALPLPKAVCVARSNSAPGTQRCTTTSARSCISRATIEARQRHTGTGQGPLQPFPRKVAVSNEEPKSRGILQLLQMSGRVSTHALASGDLMFAESQDGRGLPVELIVRDGCLTFLSLGQVFWSDLSSDKEDQAFAERLVRCVVFGAARRLKSGRACYLVCGGGAQFAPANTHELNRWPAWSSTDRKCDVTYLRISCLR